MKRFLPISNHKNKKINIKRKIKQKQLKYMKEFQEDRL